MNGNNGVLIGNSRSAVQGLSIILCIFSQMHFDKKWAVITLPIIERTEHESPMYDKSLLKAKTMHSIWIRRLTNKGWTCEVQLT